MSRSKSLITVLAGVCYLLLCWAAIADQRAEEKALGVAETWLSLVDNGRYSESWETTAVLFRNAVTKEQWERTLKAGRKPLGRLIARRLKWKQYATSLPGAPDVNTWSSNLRSPSRTKKLRLRLSLRCSTRMGIGGYPVTTLSRPTKL